MKRRRGSITLETAILFPIILIAIVILINVLISACKTGIQAGNRISDNTKKWSESCPGKGWGGAKNAID